MVRWMDGGLGGMIGWRGGWTNRLRYGWTVTLRDVLRDGWRDGWMIGFSSG